jgi:RimK family alpha-L-glutamate ligase
MQGVVSIGVLHSPESTTGNAIEEAIRAFGHRAVRLDHTELGLRTHNGAVQFSEQVDAVVNWSGFGATNYGTQVAGIIGILDTYHPTVNGLAGMSNARNKALALARLNSAGVPIPDFAYSRSVHYVAREADRHEVAVHKPVFGGGGTDVAKVSGHDDISLLSGPNAGLLQEYIDTGEDVHTDVRAFVVGDTVVAAMERRAPDDDWRTNISKGGEGAAIDLPAEARTIARDACRILDLDAAGVDLIRAANGEWGVIEVNAPAGFSGLYRATDHNVAADIAALALAKAGHPVDDERVRAVATRPLDARDILTAADTGYSLGESVTFTVAGRDGATRIDAQFDEAVTEWVLDQQVAGEVGAHLTGTDASVFPEHDHDVPVGRVWIDLKHRGFYMDCTIEDLYEYDADALYPSRVLLSTDSAIGGDEEGRVEGGIRGESV